MYALEDSSLRRIAADEAEEIVPVFEGQCTCCARLHEGNGDIVGKVTNFCPGGQASVGDPERL